MKFKLLVISLLSIFIFTPIVSAQEATLTPRNVQNRENAKTNVENKKEEIQLKITAIKRERIRSHYGKMVVRIEALIARIQTLIDRLETRIAKIDNPEINTLKANEDILLAQATLNSASEELDSLDIEKMLVSDTPNNDFDDIRNTVKSIKTKLNKVHVLLVHIIGDLKGLRVGDTNEE